MADAWHLQQLWGNCQVRSSEGSKKMAISWAAFMTAAAVLSQQWHVKVQQTHYGKECKGRISNSGRLETFWSIGDKK